MRSPLLSTGLGLALAASLSVDSAPAAETVVTVVKVAKPWYVPTFFITKKFRDTIPQYRAIDGLQFKYYTHTRDGKFGGIYLWRDAAAAEAWFTPQWFQRVREQRGVEGHVVRFDAVEILENAPVTNAEGNSIATIVTIPIPAGVTRAQLAAGFRQSLPEYRTVPGLLRKYFVLTSDGKFGGVYLWRDAAAAAAHFTGARRAQASARDGAEPQIEYFDVPVLTPGKDAPSPRP